MREGIALFMLGKLDRGNDRLDEAVVMEEVRLVILSGARCFMFSIRVRGMKDGLMGCKL
jgi:hypothetical protein